MPCSVHKDNGSFRYFRHFAIRVKLVILVRKIADMLYVTRRRLTEFSRNTLNNCVEQAENSRRAIYMLRPSCGNLSWTTDE